MIMKTNMKETVLYVVYRLWNGVLESKTVNVKGKVNHLTVEEAIRSKLYDRYDFDRLISWQVEEEFTYEEQEEFLKTI